MRTLPFKANYRQDPRIGFEERKKEKCKGAEKSVEKIKEIQEKTKAALGKAQKEIKRYTDKRRREGGDYKVGDLVMLCHDLAKWLSHYFFFLFFIFLF